MTNSSYVLWVLYDDMIISLLVFFFFVRTESTNKLIFVGIDMKNVQYLMLRTEDHAAGVGTSWSNGPIDHVNTSWSSFIS